MFFIWGPQSGVRDLGVVAELCPQCAYVMPCRVFGKVEGAHIFFIPVASGVTEVAAICSHCQKRFRCDINRYKAMLSEFDAFSLTVDELLDQTNPSLKARIEWSRKCEELGDDPRFTQTLRSVDELRPGLLMTRLSKELRRWDQLDEAQRANLTRESSELARAMKFALSISTQVPENAGCAIGFLICLAVWGAAFVVPASISKSNGFVLGAALAGPLLGSVVYQFIVSHQVRQWTREVLVPEGRKSGISFQHFVSLLEDLSPARTRSADVLDPLKEYGQTIREELATLEVSIDRHNSESSS